MKGRCEMFEGKTFEEVTRQLESLGYRFFGYRRGDVESYSFTKETYAVDLAPYLPMEKISLALSGLKKVEVFGWYIAKLLVKDGLLRQVDHSFGYELKGGYVKDGHEGAFVVISVHGPMSAPFPHGRPIGYNIDARVFIDPKSAGSGRRARVRQAAKEVLAALPEFVEAFPDARVYAELVVVERETGRVRDLVSSHRR
jgi:hypothetical protein